MYFAEKYFMSNIIDKRLNTPVLMIYLKMLEEEEEEGIFT